MDGILDGTEFNMQLELDPAMCQTSNVSSLPVSTIIVRYFRFLDNSQ